MMQVSLQAFMALALWAGVGNAQILANSTCAATSGTIYDFSLSALDGGRFSLDEYTGKVMVIFNQATYCDLTYTQMTSWNAIVEELNNENFDLLSIPTNQFGLLEPAQPQEILNGLGGVRPGSGFVPSFRVAAKTECNGLGEENLYTFLKDACLGPSNMMGETARYYWSPMKQNDITWNYEKFLINSQGKPVRRYTPDTSPLDIVGDIQALLAEIQPAAESPRKARLRQGLAKKNKKNRYNRN